MKVARSSSHSATSGRLMPLTTREPQNGGVGIGLSTATSERAGTCTGSASTRVAARTRRLRSSGRTASGSPRRKATRASISRRPSNASRAYRTSPW
jgi:hypothetical protein